MKFSRHLSSHLTPEWYPQYINYEEMKKMLYSTKEKAEGLDLVKAAAVFDKADEAFLDYCQKELNKIEAFYVEKLAEAKRKFMELKNDSMVEFISRRLVYSDHGRYPAAHFTFDKRKIRMMRLGFSELYLLLVLIQNYQSLNCTGFRKILKKHDKLFLTCRGAQWNQENVLSANFVTDKTPEDLIKQVEDIFTIYFENGNRSSAMKTLRVPKIGENIQLSTSFRLGFLSGMCLVVSPLIIVYSICLGKRVKDIPWETATRLYRFIFLFILQVGLSGVNVLGWSRAGVNHVLIFEIDPRRHLNYQQILEIATFLLLLFELSIGCSLVCIFTDRFMLLNPLVLFVVIILLIFNPTNFLHRRARRWLVSSLVQCFTPCLQPVQFRHFWLGDQLTSQSLAFSDFYYFIVFYTLQYPWKRSNSEQRNLLRPSLDSSVYYYLFWCIFVLLPHFARFSQCLRRYRDNRQWFPHLINAGKYMSSFPVVIMSVIRPTIVEEASHADRRRFMHIFVLFSLIEASYKLAWDLRMDWGLLEPKYSLLRESTVYSPTGVYYLAIVENCVLRFAWLGKFLLHDNIAQEHLYFDTIFGVAEICRRFVWNFFRLENEHLNNCGQFRAVRDISFGPIKRQPANDLHVMTVSNEESLKIVDNGQISDELDISDNENQLTSVK